MNRTQAHEFRKAETQQLPARAYLDPRLYDLEISTIFETAPKYVGHELLIPNVGDYFVAPSENNSRVLIRTDRGVRLISNVCKHRQALLLHGMGNASRIVCPLHHWNYDIHGQILRAPKFDEQPQSHLQIFETQNWNGMIFNRSTPDIATTVHCLDAATRTLIDFSKHELGRVESLACNYNWKTFIEFYLELYHVTSFHPGLGKLVACDELKWGFGDYCSVQKVGIKRNPRFSTHASSYPDWCSAINEHYPDPPPYGAIWIYIYPATMIEWYRLVLVVSTIVPDGPERCKNHLEFYHPRGLLSRGGRTTQGVRAAASAYIETALEDNELGERMQEGRRAMAANRFSEVGPYHMPLELGMKHFHGIYRSQIPGCVEDLCG